MTFGTANATISYLAETNTYLGQDPLTDKPLYQKDTVVQSIEVSIEKDTVEQVVSKDLYGKKQQENFYSGRLVNPLTIPSWYKKGGTYDIVFDNSSKTGKWYAYETVSSRFGLESRFGQQIEGVITN